ncbi:MAG: OmpH family outer membrane protein [Bryobacteraceae bacterium]
MRFVFPVLATCVMGFMSVAPAMAQSKIGVIDFQRAAVDTAEFKKAFADLETKYKPKQDQLVKAQQTLQDIEAQVRATQGQLSQAGAAELEAKGKRTQLQVDRLTEDLQEGFEGERDASLRVISTRLTELLKKFATDKGLDMIIDKQAIPYSTASFDVTDAAVAAYNAAHPVK